MKPYKNLSGTSNVVSYEATDTSIHIVFRTGAHRNYLYDQSRPGKAMVDRMRMLAEQGSGLNSYINEFVRKSFARKW